MAARTNKIRHDDETRAKIQTSQLINRLQDHVFGEANISQTQLKSIEILLRKTLPDLTATEHSGEVTTRHEDALEQLDRPPAGDTAEAQGQSSTLRGDVPADSDQGRLH